MQPYIYNKYIGQERSSYSALYVEIEQLCKNEILGKDAQENFLSDNN